MTTITVTQRIQEGDTSLERSASLSAEALPSDAADQLCAILNKAGWTTPPEPTT